MELAPPGPYYNITTGPAHGAKAIYRVAPAFFFFILNCAMGKVTRTRVRRSRRWQPYAAALLRRGYHYIKGRFGSTVGHQSRLHNSGAYTKTLLRKYKKKSTVIPAGDSHENANLTYKIGRKHKFRKPPNSILTTYNNSGGRLTQGVGYQLVQVPFAFLDQTDLNLMFSKITNEDTSGGRVANTKKMIMYTQQAHLMLTNSTTAGNIITIYHLICRKDNSIAPDVAFTNGMTDENGATCAFFLGAHPKTSQKFRELWAIKKVTRRFLGPGASMDCSLKAKCNITIGQQRVTTTSQYYAGITSCFLIVCRGVPINDAAVPSNVYTSGVVLDAVWTKTFRMTWVPQAQERVYFTDNVDHIPVVPQQVLLENSTVAAYNTA